MRSHWGACFCSLLILPNVAGLGRHCHLCEAARRVISELGSRPVAKLSSTACCAPIQVSRSISIAASASAIPERSEEHTSELQSHSDLVCRLLLEKKK